MCDLEDPDIWQEQTVRARKEYECSDCEHPIVVGETHVIMEGFYRDSGWSRHRVHVYCRSWRSAHRIWMLEYWGDDCGAELGGLLSALEEAQREVARNGVSITHEAWRDRVLSRLAKGAPLDG
jgi:hypothetical protein